MRTLKTILATAPLLALLQASAAPAIDTILPPLPPWQSRSAELIAAPSDRWITPAEQSGLTATPRYEQTVEYLRRLASAARELHLVSIGSSAEGREIWMVVATAEGAATPAAVSANGRPTLLAQAGIHAGEIDGKDAGLMLLRDLSAGGRLEGLLEQVNLLFVPILNVDGHERFSAYGRINQRGPVEMGWRSNARNLNLNRDYTKIETEGVAAIVATIERWQPLLYVDLHVTDGVDYEYDITFGYNREHAWSPAIARWLETHLEPATTRALRNRGHVPGPLIFAKNDRDYAAGISDWTASPRYSNGYGDARHLASVLVENHSLKPYMQRVLGTYVLLEAMLRTLGEHGEALAEATSKDRRRRPAQTVLSWEDRHGLPETMILKGIGSTREYSPVAGAEVTRWNGEPVDVAVAVRANDRPGASVSRPAQYVIPAGWSAIGARLAAHGIVVAQAGPKRAGERIAVERYRLPDAALASGVNPYEGRVRIDPGTPVVEQGEWVLAAGDLLVATDQPLGTLAMLLLEPQAPDSLLQWGYFLEIMNATEYYEQYAVEPLAAAMLAADRELARQFEARLRQDKAFAADADARLRWFYERSPYFDQRYRLYPIARSRK